MKRFCTKCIADGKKQLAQYVAVDATGLAWYECEIHSDTDNVAGVIRIHREPIEEFFIRVLKLGLED